MFLCQMRTGVKPYKSDEFVSSIHSCLPGIRRQSGCLGCGLYQDSENENTYILVAEWKTHQAMQEHLQTNEFQVLIGAARVLGDTFEISMGEASKTGDYKSAGRQIRSRQRKRPKAD